MLQARSARVGRPGGLPYKLLEQLLGLRTGRIFGRQVHAQVSLEQFAGDVEIPFGLDQQIGLGEYHLGTVRRDLLGARDALVGLLQPSLPGQQPRQVDEAADLLRCDLDGASQLPSGKAAFRSSR